MVRFTLSLSILTIFSIPLALRPMLSYSGAKNRLRGRFVDIPSQCRQSAVVVRWLLGRKESSR
jgi:hypothetical protein